MEQETRGLKAARPAPEGDESSHSSAFARVEFNTAAYNQLDAGVNLSTASTLWKPRSETVIDHVH
jgi:hypothetical protein